MNVSDARCLKIVAAVCVCLSNPVKGGEDDMSQKELAYLTMQVATVRVAVEHAPFYAKAEPNAQPIRSLSWVSPLRVDASKVTSAPAGWIPIREPRHVTRKSGDISGGWVRRRDVVLPVDYKKVIGCWPIKSVTFVAGDYAAKVRFELDGSASVKEWGDEEKVSKAPPHKAHVYMARNIISIADIEGKAGFFTSGYRPDERRLYPEGAPAEEQQLFPESMLAGCRSVPLLAD